MLMHLWKPVIELIDNGRLLDESFNSMIASKARDLTFVFLKSIEEETTFGKKANFHCVTIY